MIENRERGIEREREIYRKRYNDRERGKKRDIL